MKVPCKNCEERALGCQCSCKKYIAFRQEREEIYKKRRMSSISRTPYQTNFKGNTKKFRSD